MNVFLFVLTTCCWRNITCVMRMYVQGNNLNMLNSKCNRFQLAALHNLRDSWRELCKDWRVQPIKTKIKKWSEQKNFYDRFRKWISMFCLMFYAFLNLKLFLCEFFYLQYWWQYFYFALKFLKFQIFPSLLKNLFLKFFPLFDASENIKLQKLQELKIARKHFHGLKLESQVSI